MKNASHYGAKVERLLEVIVTQASLESRRTALRLLRATAQVLGEVLPVGVARRVAGSLPFQLQDWLCGGAPPVAASARTFVWRVATLAGVDITTARRSVPVVLTNLAAFCGQPTLDQLRAGLPLDCPMLLLHRKPLARPARAERFEPA